MAAWPAGWPPISAFSKNYFIRGLMAAFFFDKYIRTSINKRAPKEAQQSAGLFELSWTPSFNMSQSK